MQELGWSYVNLDDCWVDKERGKDGKLTWDPTRLLGVLEVWGV